MLFTKKEKIISFNIVILIQFKFYLKSCLNHLAKKYQVSSLNDHKCETPYIHSYCTRDIVFLPFPPFGEIKGRRKEAQGWKKVGRASFVFLLLSDPCYHYGLRCPPGIRPTANLRRDVLYGWYKNNGDTPNRSKHPTKVVF